MFKGIYYLTQLNKKKNSTQNKFVSNAKKENKKESIELLINVKIIPL